MNCPSCGAPLADNAKFCTHCGAAMASFSKPMPEEAPIPKAPEPPVMPTPKSAEPNPYDNARYSGQNGAAYYSQPANPSASLPPQYKPIGAWGYFGLNILYSLPLIGFIFLIVFSFSDGNINRRSHARSYWCGLLVSIILVIIVVVLCLVTGAFSELADAVGDVYDSLGL